MHTHSPDLTLSTGISLVLVTAPQGDPALKLAREVVEEGLAACVNLVPSIRSIYRWQGKIEDDAETLLILKTRTEVVEALRQRIVELHPYSVPEVLAVEVDRGHAPYLAWVLEQVRGPSSPR